MEKTALSAISGRIETGIHEVLRKLTSGRSIRQASLHVFEISINAGMTEIL